MMYVIMGTDITFKTWSLAVRYIAENGGSIKYVPKKV